MLKALGLILLIGIFGWFYIEDLFFTDHSEED